nr:hypothetical protein [Burkholderiaceae bacterium]
MDRFWQTASVRPLDRDLPFASKPTTAKVSSLGVRRKIGHGHQLTVATGSLPASRLVGSAPGAVRQTGRGDHGQQRDD